MRGRHGAQGPHAAVQAFHFTASKAGTATGCKRVLCVHTERTADSSGATEPKIRCLDLPGCDKYTFGGIKRMATENTLLRSGRGHGSADQQVNDRLVVCVE